MIDENKIDELMKNYHSVLPLDKDYVSLCINIGHHISQNDIQINYYPYLQGKSGYCWIESALQCISIYIKNNTNKDIIFDDKYLIFYDKLEKIDRFLTYALQHAQTKDAADDVICSILDKGITDKGHWKMAVNLIKKYGLLPTKSVESNSKINYKQLNAVLSFALRQYAVNIINEVDESKRNKYYDEALQISYNILIDFFGKDFNQYTDINIARLFFDNYVKFPFDDYICLAISDCVKAIEIIDDGNIYGMPGNVFLCTPNNLFNNALISQINEEDFCWCTLDAGKFYLKKSYILDSESIKTTHLKIVNNELDASTVFKYHIARPTHAMTILKISSVDGKKIYISYDSGYNEREGHICYITDSWFHKYLFQGVVNKKFVPSEYLNAIDISNKIISKEYFK